MRCRSVVLLLSIATDVLAQKCLFHSECSEGMFCYGKQCRKESCTVSSQCEEGELCQYGDVQGRRKTACFPAKIENTNVQNKNKFCTGGGKAVFNFKMELATCDSKKQCPEGSVCNPLFGVCCTKLRTCPLPAKTMINTKTKRPVICLFKGTPPLVCPIGGYCETQTGFCCRESEGGIPEEEVEKEKEKEEEDKEEKPGTLSELIKLGKLSKGTEKEAKPWRGSSCKPEVGCDGNAACICSVRNICKCECAAEFGYSPASDGKNCIRVRRRLKEKCKNDMECSAAFSECSTGGCRCKRGFQRDGDGGCKPINYQCVGKQAPLVKDSAVVTCNLKQSMKKHFKPAEQDSAPVDETINFLQLQDPADGYVNASLADNERDDCPDGHYCVPVFDNPMRRGYYQGFCCPSPGEINPICPVGVAHESSAYPDYGCRECPIDHFCHRDSVATEKEICCPKPCVSLEDIYMNGQCLSTAFYGDSCTLSAQCQYQKDSMPEDEYTQLMAMECTKGVCSCPAGFSFTDGSCKRITCTIGLKGEPSVDRFNNLIRCDRSADCSQGFMCDPNTRVCCKGVNRCPKNYVETGDLCNEDNCRGANEMCHRTKKGKAKICCRLEDTDEYKKSNRLVSFFNIEI